MFKLKEWITKVNQKLRTPIIKDQNMPTSTPSASYYSDNADPKSSYAITDENDSQAAFMQAIYNTSDQRGAQFGTRRTVNGDNYYNAVTMAMDVNGDPLVWFGSSAGSAQNAWLAALGIPKSPLVLSGSFSSATGGWTAKNAGTANKTGLMIGRMFVSFQYNATGRRASVMGVDGNYIEETYMTGMAVTQADPTRHIVPIIVGVTSGQTIGLRVWQNSGSALNVSYAFHYVII